MAQPASAQEPKYLRISNLERTHQVIGKEKIRRLGEVIVLQNDQGKKIMLKEKKPETQEDCQRDVKQALERMKLNHPNLLQMLDYSATRDDEQYKIKGFYEYVEHDLGIEIHERRETNTPFRPDELRAVLIEILEVVGFLKENKMVHGDIRPEYIILQGEKPTYKLADRLGDPSPPTRVQLRNIRKDKPLYISPQLFYNMINHMKGVKDFKPVKMNPYLSEGYSIGLVILEAGILTSIQDIYNKDTGEIELDVLGEHLQNFADRYQELDLGLYRAIEDLLEISEEERPDLMMLLTGLKSTPFQSEDEQGNSWEAEENWNETGSSARKFDGKKNGRNSFGLGEEQNLRDYFEDGEEVDLHENDSPEPIQGYKKDTKETTEQPTRNYADQQHIFQAGGHSSDDLLQGGSAKLAEKKDDAIIPQNMSSLRHERQNSADVSKSANTQIVSEGQKLGMRNQNQVAGQPKTQDSQKSEDQQVPQSLQRTQLTWPIQNQNPTSSVRTLIPQQQGPTRNLSTSIIRGVNSQQTPQLRIQEPNTIQISPSLSRSNLQRIDESQIRSTYIPRAQNSSQSSLIQQPRTLDQTSFNRAASPLNVIQRQEITPLPDQTTRISTTTIIRTNPDHVSPGYQVLNDNLTSSQIRSPNQIINASDNRGITRIEGVVPNSVIKNITPEKTQIQSGNIEGTRSSAFYQQKLNELTPNSKANQLNRIQSRPQINEVVYLHNTIGPDGRAIIQRSVSPLPRSQNQNASTVIGKTTVTPLKLSPTGQSQNIKSLAPSKLIENVAERAGENLAGQPSVYTNTITRVQNQRNEQPAQQTSVKLQLNQSNYGRSTSQVRITQQSTTPEVLQKSGTYQGNSASNQQLQFYPNNRQQVTPQTSTSPYNFTKKLDTNNLSQSVYLKSIATPQQKFIAPPGQQLNIDQRQISLVNTNLRSSVIHNTTYLKPEEHSRMMGSSYLGERRESVGNSVVLKRNESEYKVFQYVSQIKTHFNLKESSIDMNLQPQVPENSRRNTISRNLQVESIHQVSRSPQPSHAINTQTILLNRQPGLTSTTIIPEFQQTQTVYESYHPSKSPLKLSQKKSVRIIRGGAEIDEPIYEASSSLIKKKRKQDVQASDKELYTILSTIEDQSQQRDQIPVVQIADQRRCAQIRRTQWRQKFSAHFIGGCSEDDVQGTNRARDAWSQSILETSWNEYAWLHLPEVEPRIHPANLLE